MLQLRCDYVIIYLLVGRARGRKPNDFLAMTPIKLDKEGRQYD